MHTCWKMHEYRRASSGGLTCASDPTSHAGALAGAPDDCDPSATPLAAPPKGSSSSLGWRPGDPKDDGVSGDGGTCGWRLAMELATLLERLGRDCSRACQGPIASLSWDANHRFCPVSGKSRGRSASHTGSGWPPQHPHAGVLSLGIRRQPYGRTRRDLEVPQRYFCSGSHMS